MGVIAHRFFFVLFLLLKAAEWRIFNMTQEQYVKELEANDLEVTSGKVMLKEPGEIAPTFDLDMCFKEKLSAEDVKQRLINFSEYPADMPEFISKLMSNQLKTTWVLRGKKRNEFAITEDFYGMYKIPVCREGEMSVCVTDNILERWGISKDEFFKSITVNQDWDVVNLASILRECPDVPLTDLEDLPMYVITNKDRIDGAAVLLDSDFLESVRQRIGDFVILPSSRHEIIAVPMSECNADFSTDRTMVQQVNETAVDSRDFLSDDVFVFTEKGLAIAD